MKKRRHPDPARQQRATHARRLGRIPTTHSLDDLERRIARRRRGTVADRLMTDIFDIRAFRRILDGRFGAYGL